MKLEHEMKDESFENVKTVSSFTFEPPTMFKSLKSW